MEQVDVKNDCKIDFYELKVGGTEVQRDKVKIILNEFAEVLNGRIGGTKLIAHEIRLTHPQPIALKPYSYPRAKQQMIDNMLCNVKG